MSPKPSKGTSRPSLVVGVLAFAGLLSSFMQTILIPIQGELPVLLDASRTDTAWVITVTLLVSAVFTPISGRLGDMYGKRRIALVLLASLTVGSLVAALSTDLATLIVGRGMQGTGMGVIPLGIAVLRDVMPPRRLGSSVALVSATLGVGAALGLTLGAFLTERADWHILFWLVTALGGFAFVLFAVVIPASTLRTGGRFDIVGAIGLAIGLTGGLLALSKGDEWGWASPLTMLFGLGGVVVLLGWGLFELRKSDPLVDLRVSARPTVLMTNLASVTMGFALFSTSVVFPQLLQTPTLAGGLGVPLLETSLLLMPGGLTMLAMSPVAGRIEHRYGPKPLLVAGSITLVISYLLAICLQLSAWHLLVINSIVGVGIGLGYAAMPALIMGAVPSTATASANGLNALMRALGSSLAGAGIAAILARNTMIVQGVSYPDAGAFQLALILGLVAAGACVTTALFIPHPRPSRGEHPSLPDGVL